MSIIHFLMLAMSCLKIAAGVPTFGNEYVHIKLHVPKEAAVNAQHNVRHLENAAHSAVHHAQPVVLPAKVIHHYHHRRRPSKKSPLKVHHNSLLDSIVVSELKRPEHTGHLDFLNHAGEIADHLVEAAPEYKPAKIKTIETYKVLEETQPQYKPKQHIETFQVIESKEEQQQHHPRVETLKIIDTKEPTYHRYKAPEPETYKVIEEDYHYTRKPAYEVESVRYRPFTSEDNYLKRPHTAAESFGSNVDYLHESHGEPYIVEESFASRPPSQLYESVPPKSIKGSNLFDDLGSSTYDNRNEYVVHRDLLPPRVQEPAPVEEQIDDYHSKTKYAHNHSHTYRDDDGNYVKNSLKHGEYLPPSSKDYSSAAEWRPQLQGGSEATETYTGPDSYSANHVQGLGSGGYKYAPFL